VGVPDLATGVEVAREPLAARDVAEPVTAILADRRE